MHEVQLQLPDQLYDRAQRRAVEAGFKSVSDYIRGIVTDDLAVDSENLDHLFTPERLALIDKAADEVRAGQFFTAEEADAELARRRAEWRQSRPA